eukprot:SAG31_NODE_8191_length_1500_cov_1.581727_2_plen_144_part_00
MTPKLDAVPVSVGRAEDFNGCPRCRGVVRGVVCALALLANSPSEKRIGDCNFFKKAATKGDELLRGLPLGLHSSSVDPAAHACGSLEGASSRARRFSLSSELRGGLPGVSSAMAADQSARCSEMTAVSVSSCRLSASNCPQQV